MYRNEYHYNKRRTATGQTLPELVIGRYSTDVDDILAFLSTTCLIFVRHRIKISRYCNMMVAIMSAGTGGLAGQDGKRKIFKNPIFRQLQDF